MFWACKVVSKRYRMILKTFIPPKSTTRQMIRTRWTFLPCRSSDRHDWLKFLPILSDHLFHVQLKRHKHILSTFKKQFFIKKLTMRFTINENINSYLCLREWYLEIIALWLAGWSVPNCIKVEAHTLIQVPIMCVKGKHVSKCFGDATKKAYSKCMCVYIMQYQFWLPSSFLSHGSTYLIYKKAQ